MFHDRVLLLSLLRVVSSTCKTRKPTRKRHTVAALDAVTLPAVTHQGLLAESEADRSQTLRRLQQPLGK